MQVLLKAILKIEHWAIKQKREKLKYQKKKIIERFKKSDQKTRMETINEMNQLIKKLSEIESESKKSN